MIKETFEKIDKYYDELIERYGHDSRACDYGDQRSQQVKFTVLSEIDDLSGHRILDVGCGFGDYAFYLQNKFKDIHYSGIDICKRMIKMGREIYPDLDLRNANILDDKFDERYDYISANGIFYLLGQNAEKVMRRIVEKMYRLADLGVSFNSLSQWAGDKEPGEFYADPMKTIDYCMLLSPHVVLRHDYHPRDFTIYIYKRRYDDRIN